MLYDFRHKELPTLGLEPPPADMWRDWSRELQNAPRSWSAEVARANGLVGRLVGGVRVTEELAGQPLDQAIAAKATAAAEPRQPQTSPSSAAKL
eukprot:SAG22_NODE_499_length_9725_cov_2.325784_4_plen_94_part_00